MPHRQTATTLPIKLCGRYVLDKRTREKNRRPRHYPPLLLYHSRVARRWSAKGPLSRAPTCSIWTQSWQLLPLLALLRRHLVRPGLRHRAGPTTCTPICIRAQSMLSRPSGTKTPTCLSTPTGLVISGVKNRFSFPMRQICARLLVTTHSCISSILHRIPSSRSRPVGAVEGHAE